MSTGTRIAPIILDYRDRGNQVVVVPADEDRYVTTVEEAIKACEKPLEFQKQFQNLLQHLATWLEQRQQEVQKAYLTFRDTDLLFLVVQASAVHERDLEDALTELDVQVACSPEFSLLTMSVLAVPGTCDSAQEAFLVPARTLEFRRHAN